MKAFDQNGNHYLVNGSLYLIEKLKIKIITMNNGIRGLPVGNMRRYRTLLIQGSTQRSSTEIYTFIVRNMK